MDLRLCFYFGIYQDNAVFNILYTFGDKLFEKVSGKTDELVNKLSESEFYPPSIFSPSTPMRSPPSGDDTISNEASSIFDKLTIGGGDEDVTSSRDDDDLDNDGSASCILLDHYLPVLAGKLKRISA